VDLWTAAFGPPGSRAKAVRARSSEGITHGDSGCGRNEPVPVDPHLNTAQLAAARHRGSPLLVLAGAGTGKTRVITHRVAALLDEGVAPWRVLAVTFTNKAAAQMRTRIGDLCRERHDVSQLWVGTFHAICARILRRYGDAVGLTSRFTIYDTSDQLSVMGRVLQDLRVSDRLYTPRGVLGHIDRAKNRGLGPEAIDDLGIIEPVRTVVRSAYERYDAQLRAEDAADFGDLLVLTVRLLEHVRPPGTQLGEFSPASRLETRFEHVVVDEYQDTNPVQARLVDLLASQAELCVVGDDDQAIYGWRGADVRQILDFPSCHAGCELIRLEQNYRSTMYILHCADAVISENRGRMGKRLWSELGDGAKVRVLVFRDERDEAELLAREIALAVAHERTLDEFAVFYRTHAQSRVIEEALQRHGLRYRVVGGLRFLDRLEIKDLLAYLRILVNPRADVDLLRIANRPARGIGATSLARIERYAAETGRSVWDALDQPEQAGLKSAAAKRVRELKLLLEGLATEISVRPLDDVAELVLERTGYREMLAAEDSEESHDRLENLQEFLGALTEFSEHEPDATLVDYLERISLTSAEDQDNAEGPSGTITLMTVHGAKGLEFDQVYVTGMEDGVFPHARVLDDFDQMEEERRLAYVAFTRARQGLTISLARRRLIHGQLQVNLPSRFIRRLPAAAIERHDLSVSETHVRDHVRPEAWQSDIVYDDGPRMTGGPADEHAHAMQLYVGMGIRHPQFGEGELIGWSGAGAQLKLVLHFPGHGTKTILSRFCEPSLG